MKKRIFRSVISLVLVVLLLSFVITTAVLYNYFNKIQISQLKNDLYRSSVTMNKYGEEYLKNLSDSPFRYTWIAPNGKVLYDTKVNSANMENHLDRVEIEEALKTGQGSSVRYSSTLTEKTIYASVVLKDGSVLRVSIAQKTITALLISMLPYIFAVILLIILIALVLANKVALKITKPLYELDLDNPTENNTYEELSPVLTKLNKQHKQIKMQMEKLKSKQDEFDQIISSMNEGLVLLDENGMVLSMNAAAQKVFDVKEDVAGRDFLTIDRTLEISKAVSEAVRGIHTGFRLQRHGREYELNFSPIVSGYRKLGVVLLAVDVTDKAFAERNRQEFTANVTHELKTPLQSIIGCAELLETGLARPEDESKFIVNIRKEATRLVDLIDDIISLSRLDEHAKLNREKVSLQDVATEVVDVLAAAAAKKHVAMHVEGDDVSVKGVRRYLYEIIYNLCDNAIRYNKEGGSVTIKLYKDSDHTIIAVHDTGTGISLEDQDRIFERFYRVDKSHSRESGGTGLGLSIVKHAVQLHNGRLEIDSELGKGTTIRVIL